eukprot:12231923-Ditylum_brightwellii.AAC.1
MTSNFAAVLASMPNPHDLMALYLQGEHVVPPCWSQPPPSTIPVPEILPMPLHLHTLGPGNMPASTPPQVPQQPAQPTYPIVATTLPHLQQHFLHQLQ